MSADNGIYILKTLAPTGRGFEFRIIHAQAIENLTYQHPTGNPCEIINYYLDTKVMTNQNKALKSAHNLYEEYTKDGGYVEYGVSIIEFEKTFEEFIILAIPQLRQMIKDTINGKINTNYDEGSKLYEIQSCCELLRKLLHIHPELRKDKFNK
jgi:hypothetical protein